MRGEKASDGMELTFPTTGGQSDRGTTGESLFDLSRRPDKGGGRPGGAEVWMIFWSKGANRWLRSRARRC